MKCQFVIFCLVVLLCAIQSLASDEYDAAEKFRIEIIEKSKQHPSVPLTPEIKYRFKVILNLFTDYRDRIVTSMSEVTLSLRNSVEEFKFKAVVKGRDATVVTAAVENVNRTIDEIESVTSTIYKKFINLENTGSSLYIAFLNALEEKKENLARKLKSQSMKEDDVVEHIKLKYIEWNTAYDQCAINGFGMITEVFVKWTRTLEEIQSKWHEALDVENLATISNDAEVIVKFKTTYDSVKEELKEMETYAIKELDQAYLVGTKCYSKSVVEPDE